MPKKVPVIITGDVDFSDHHSGADKRAILQNLLEITRSMELRCSFLFTAKEAQKFPDIVHDLSMEGHEIGCHGLTHGDEEEYNNMAPEKQRAYIHEATDIISKIVGTDVVSFRAPRVKVSATMYQTLSEAGYIVDSSVCSQRMDLVSSNLFNMDWLFAPRLPYHPSKRTPYRRGNMALTVVPVSALGFPFISSLLYVVGPKIMKGIFRLFYLESCFTGKPIVYLFHPYDFIPEIRGARNYGKNIKVHGLRFRRYFRRRDPSKRFQDTIELWKYIMSCPGTLCLTLKQYVIRSQEQTKGMRCPTNWLSS